jgi:beta-galactosidase
MKYELPFIFGTQYYRAPTPESECWENDLQHIKELGMNSIKFWVQWRWTHRQENTFYFDDIDQLMDIANKNDLKVTLNIIFDVAPVWLYKKHPDAMQIINSGHYVTPEASACRQIGGFPNPCYNHEEAKNQRMRFLKAVIERYKNHPAMDMWDVWNEPEQCSIYRNPQLSTLTCYCDNCHAKFTIWLKEKYLTLENLNSVWGRCYVEWSDVELPKNGSTFEDFIDFREFHLDTMTLEAQWRIRLVKHLDKNHTTYLHVVPNTLRIFNSITCVDDFELAKECDVFASTMFAGPMWGIQTLSAGKGKVCYNVESHIGNGSIRMHQKKIHLNDILKDFLPQIGMGVRGFMFWQYRPEVLGVEAPAWGVVNLDGSDRSFSYAAKEFWTKMKPYTEKLMKESTHQSTNIAIWTSRKNELFHFCAFSNLLALADSIESYVDMLYWNNYNIKFINSEDLEQKNLDGIKVLIMPSCYCLTEKEADSLSQFVKDGGVLLCEAHLGGYNATKGRHSRNMPGCQLNLKWEINEIETTSSHHLNIGHDQSIYIDGLSEDVKKAIDAYGTTGGKYFPIKMTNENVIFGAERFAIIEGNDIERWGEFDGKCCIGMKKLGKGYVVYCGSNLGEGAKYHSQGFAELINKVCKLADIEPKYDSLGGNIRIDSIGDEMLIIHNRAKDEQVIKLECHKTLQGVFSQTVIENNISVKIKGGFVDLFVTDFVRNEGS